jgi:hypothetical protein
MSDEQSPKSKVQGQKSEEAQAVRTPQVFAGECPNNAAHLATRVYKTLGEVRYCVCDDCGRTWKKEGPRATPKAKERATA